MCPINTRYVKVRFQNSLSIVMRPMRGCKKPRLVDSSGEEDEAERDKLKDLVQRLPCYQGEGSLAIKTKKSVEVDNVKNKVEEDKAQVEQERVKVEQERVKVELRGERIIRYSNIIRILEAEY